MPLRHDAFEPAAGQRLDGKHRVIELGAQRHQFAFAEQQIIDGILDFQDIHLDRQVGQCPAQVRDRARHHYAGDARHRTDFQFRLGTALDSRNHKLQIFDLVIDAVDLAENRIGLWCRAVPASSTAEQLDSDGRLGVLHHPADTR